MGKAALLNQARDDLHVRRAECEAARERYLKLQSDVDTAEAYVAMLEGEAEQQEGDAIPEKANLGDMLAWVLRDGSEQHRAEITRQVEEAGFHVGGKNHVDTVGARLSTDRQERFVKGEKKGHWRLKHPPQSRAESDQPREESEVIDLSSFQTG